MQSSSKFLITVLAVTLVCVALQFYWNHHAPAVYVVSNGFMLLGVFSISVTLIHLFLMNSTQGRPQAFVNKYLGTTMLKFMFYMLLLIVLLLYSADNKKALILHFLFYYALFTVLEVGFLYNELQKLKK